MLSIPNIKYTSFSTLSNNFIDYKFTLKEDFGLLMIAASFTIKRINGIVEHFQSHQVISSYSDIPQLASKIFNHQVLKKDKQSFIIQKSKDKFVTNKPSTPFEFNFSIEKLKLSSLTYANDSSIEFIGYKSENGTSTILLKHSVKNENELIFTLLSEIKSDITYTLKYNTFK